MASLSFLLSRNKIQLFLGVNASACRVSDSSLKLDKQTNYMYCYAEIHTWNGYEYEFVNDPKTWSQAEQYCVDRGGHLTSFTSLQERYFLISTFGSVIGNV